MWIWLIVLPIVVLGCIPYGIWVIRTAVNKKWRRVGFQLVIPAGILIVLIAVTRILIGAATQDYHGDIFDAEAKLGEPLFEYNSERAFNGDGYSLSVYELTPAIRARFEAADEKPLTEFPKRPSYRKHWKSEHWREAPCEARFDRYVKFALDDYVKSVPGLAEQFAGIRAALLRKGTYYAFFYSDPSADRVGDIDFFVVDLVEGRIYLINFNT